MSELTVVAPAEAGMVATSQPLAVQAGVEMLTAGGTAADAAIAAAAALCVVEPRATGVGGDAFALYWPAGAGEPEALDGAGPSGAGATVEAIRAAGHDEMPSSGAWTITVPGAVATWARLAARHGRLGLDRLLAPAIKIADSGFEVTRAIADEWALHAGRIAGNAAAETVFLPGRAPKAGERFANHELARLLERIARDGEDGFYRGQVAELIGDAVAQAGGPLRAADLAAWCGPRFVAPVARDYRGVRVYETPPPGQGIVALAALGVFEGAEPVDRIEEEHVALESLKLAFADAAALLADPLIAEVPVARLLSDDHLAERRALIGSQARDVAAPGPATDTVYVTAVDGEGNACSFIQSLYSGFGAGIGVSGLGITLQNRGKGFVLDEGHPNQLAPGKRPYHTIIPGMLGRDGGFYGCIGCVGGFMQPQGQMQIVRHLIDHGMDIGAALAAPRLRFLDGLEIGAEPAFVAATIAGLESRGHRVRPLSNFGAGGAQAILREGDRLSGASDPRKDGCARST